MSDLGDELREYESSPAASSRRQDPKGIIRDLAENSPSESTRLSAARALVEMNAEERERREAARETQNPLAELTDEELYRMLDGDLAGGLIGILQLSGYDQGGDQPNRIVTRERYPRSFAVVETTLERIAEQRVARRVREALAANESAAEFERRVEQAARRRADGMVEARMATMRARLEERAREAAGGEVAAVEPVAEVPASGPIWIDQEAPAPALSVLG